MGRLLVVSDLEGVLIPELWPIIGQKLGLPELSATTRDMPDFRKLMESRIAALKKHNVTFDAVKSALMDVSPFTGAEKVLYNLSRIHNLEAVIISDSFHEFIDIVLKEKFKWKVFANRFRVVNGFIDSCIFDVGSRKAEILKSIREPSQKVIAIGDSFNDVEMLKSANVRILFNPISELKGMFKDAVTCNDFLDLTNIIDGICIANS